MNQKSQKLNGEPLLEIRNITLKEPTETGNTTPHQPSSSSSLKPDETIADQPPKYAASNLSAQHLDLNRTAFDYMPKYVLKQINEKRLINTSGLNNGTVYMPSTTTTVMTPYALYNTKTQYENIVDNAARDLNRKSNKSTKIQYQLLQNSQKQAQQGNTPQANQQVQGSNRSSKLFSAYSTITNNNSNKEKPETNFDIRGNLSKVNEEFLNTLATNINLASANSNTNNLFTSAFASINSNSLPLKSQYEKITTRAASTLISGSTSNNNNHTVNSNTASTARPRIGK